jgi:hypothetical protein
MATERRRCAGRAGPDPRARGIVEPRRFPPPWSIEEHNDACFIVKDRRGQALACVYFENEPGLQRNMKLFTRGSVDDMQHEIC